jgi:nucleoside-diphosphate-sugar epimerase
LAGDAIDVSMGAQRRDIMHVSDVANALVTVLESTVIGSIDISAGQAPTLREWFELLEQLTYTTGLIRYGAAELPPEDLYDAVGDPTALFGLGWRPRYPVEAIAADTVRSWSQPEILRG